VQEETIQIKPKDGKRSERGNKEDAVSALVFQLIRGYGVCTNEIRLEYCRGDGSSSLSFSDFLVYTIHKFSRWLIHAL